MKVYIKSKFAKSLLNLIKAKTFGLNLLQRCWTTFNTLYPGDLVVDHEIVVVDEEV
ncbi:hypothetical protein Syun_029058 [Stephania yunnanensis]|uniref:Uncharacterized protein n=1 Tax=Stephania yunnanensis TaxID=152371 RepID=A0AAP0ECX4_9MAGN